MEHASFAPEWNGRSVAGDLRGDGISATVRRRASEPSGSGSATPLIVHANGDHPRADPLVRMLAEVACNSSNYAAALSQPVLLLDSGMHVGSCAVQPLKALLGAGG
eukprot:6676429-Prymnesium_polylepis.1